MKRFFILVLIMTSTQVSWGRSDWFILHNLRMQYECECLSERNNGEDRSLYILSQSEGKRKKNFILTDSLGTFSKSFDLGLLRNKIYQEKKSNVIFHLTDSWIGKEKKNEVKNSLFASASVLKHIYRNDQIGNIYHFKLIQRGGSSVDPFFYAVSVNVKYGILSFGYYNGFKKFKCIMKHIEFGMP